MEAREAIAEVKKSYGAIISAVPWISDSLHCLMDCAEFGIAKAPRTVDGLDWLGRDKAMYLCPECGEEVKQHEQDYCCNCGQAIDWSGVPGYRDELENILAQMKKELGEN